MICEVSLTNIPTRFSTSWLGVHPFERFAMDSKQRKQSFLRARSSLGPVPILHIKEFLWQSMSQIFLNSQLHLHFSHIESSFFSLLPYISLPIFSVNPLSIFLVRKREERETELSCVGVNTIRGWEGCKTLVHSHPS